MERRIRLSALLVAIGTAVSLISLLIWHPLAFMLFLIVGVTLIAAGAIYYLISLARVGPPADAETARKKEALSPVNK